MADVEVFEYKFTKNKNILKIKRRKGSLFEERYNRM